MREGRRPGGWEDMKGALVTDLETETRQPWEHPGGEPLRGTAQPGRNLTCCSRSTEVSPGTTVREGRGQGEQEGTGEGMGGKGDFSASTALRREAAALRA